MDPPTLVMLFCKRKALIVLLIHINAGNELVAQKPGVEFGDRGRDVLGTVAGLIVAGRSAG